MKPQRKNPYRPRPIKIPMTGLRDTIALHMHASLAGVTAGDLDSFDSLANIINMVALALVHDSRFPLEFRLVTGGAVAMNQIGRLLEAKLHPKAHHLAPVQVAVTAIDELLPRLDVSKLFVAEKLAVATLREQRQVVATMQEAR